MMVAEVSSREVYEETLNMFVNFKENALWI